VTALGLVIRGLLVLIIAALVGGAAYQFSDAQEKTYEANASLLFSSQLRPELQVLGASFASSGSETEIRLATAAQLVASYDIARIVARRHPDLGYDADEISSRVKAGALTKTQIVRLTATGATPDRALKLADAYIREYVDTLRSRQRRNAGRVGAAVERRYDGLTARERRESTGSALRSQLGALEVLERVGSGQPEISQQPRVAGEPTQPRTQRNVLFGAIFGLALGIGLVALRDQLLRLRPDQPDQPSAAQYPSTTRAA
jgi:uncharacterized protein involved in exopolysaccharide biosynthesis